MPELSAALAWIAAGSALGGVLRFAVSRIAAQRLGERFPWGTILVNVTGSLAVGVLAAAADGELLAHPAAWEATAIGFLGSYTTVSSFSLQTLALAQSGETLRAAGNVVLSVTSCVLAAAAGYAGGLALVGAGP